MKCSICEGNLIEFSSKFMDGCILVCGNCNVSSPYAPTVPLAELAFKVLARKIKNRRDIDFDNIDFSERNPDLDCHGEEDNKSFANEPDKKEN
jgi:hypothetical protein